MRCPLCREDAATWPAPITFTFEVNCNNCGKFRITEQARQALTGVDDVAFDLGSWVYAQNLIGTSPKIEEKSVQDIKSFPRPTVEKRAELYLGRVIRLLNGKLIGRFFPNDSKLRVASWSQANDDAVSLANYLVDLGAFEDLGQERRLIAKAHIIYAAMIGHRASAAQAFVAMSFKEDLRIAYENGLALGISNAGYEPLRIDRKEHDGKIDDAIIAEIRRAAFVVADFTGHRGGVYYEAGFAHGLGHRVIFTCRRNEMGELHFDVRQYNTIPWDRPEDIIVPLQNRILAMFGAGPLKPDARPVPV